MTTTLAAGSLVAKTLRLVRPLGEGGMGRVWVARHLERDEEVAVKLILPEHLGRERSHARFAREAALAAKIRCAHVVEVLDHGVTDDGTPYLVMELLRGESLAERLARERRLPPAEVETLVAQACLALGAAHALGVVHRDVKPANLFLVAGHPGLFLKVLDFGIAKQTEALDAQSLTETGGVLGTPHYMSPEQLLAPKTADHRTDLWALAVVAYVALTGRLPFGGETVAAVAFAIKESPLAPVTSVVPSLPRELDPWFRLALCRELELRFADAEAFAAAFSDAVASRPAGADALGGATSGVATAPTKPRQGQRAPASVESAPTLPHTPSWATPDDACPSGDATAPGELRMARATTEEPWGEGSGDSLDVSLHDSTHPSPEPSAAHGTQPTLRSSDDPARHDVAVTRRGRRAAAAVAAACLAGAGVSLALVVSEPGPLPPVATTGGTPASGTASPVPAASLVPGTEPVDAAAARRDGEPHETSAASTPAPSAAASAALRPKASSASSTAPRPSPTMPAASAGLSAGCEQPFTVDEHGDLHPRLECMRPHPP